MTRFSVPDMHCDACIRAITDAVHRVDPAAELHIDLATLTVDIASSQPESRLADAIDDAGFTAQRAA